VKSGGAEDGVVAAEFERRAQRAEALATEREAAREPLRFVAGLSRAQGRAAAALEDLHRTEPWSGELRRDVERLLRPLRQVLRFASDAGPTPLATEAAARAAEEPAVARARLLAYWDGDADDYLSRAMLRPWAEVLSRAGVRPSRTLLKPLCAFCGGAPWVASRRGEGNMQGAARFLHCALCGGTWQIGRILCAACGEKDPRKLPTFSTEEYPEARIEACETCHKYVKSIDLTTDARRVPEVDDLSSLALDLWAQEKGYARIEPGPAGL
jgi:formate dehydrogenase maturation protein FdhE